MIEEKLKDLVAADAPAARDLVFQLGVMARIERRQFRRAMLTNVAMALLATVLLALMTPILQQIWPAIPMPRINDMVWGAMLIAASFVAMQFLRAEN
jgi:FtsH-binding integral membrane protein